MLVMPLAVSVERSWSCPSWSFLLRSEGWEKNAQKGETQLYQDHLRRRAAPFAAPFALARARSGGGGLPGPILIC